MNEGLVLVKVTIHSFGHLHGMPRRSGIYLDTAVLRNPHDDPTMRYLTGRDSPVREHVLGTQGAAEVLADGVEQVETLLRLYDPRDRRVDVLVGCQGGRHRSVVIADELAALLRLRGIGVEVFHHHIDRPVVEDQGDDHGDDHGGGR